MVCQSNLPVSGTLRDVSLPGGLAWKIVALPHNGSVLGTRTRDINARRAGRSRRPPRHCVAGGRSSASVLTNRSEPAEAPFRSETFPPKPPPDQRGRCRANISGYLFTDISRRPGQAV